jgi:hypothetical protein
MAMAARQKAEKKPKTAKKRVSLSPLRRTNAAKAILEQGRDRREIRQQYRISDRELRDILHRARSGLPQRGSRLQAAKQAVRQTITKLVKQPAQHRGRSAARRDKVTPLRKKKICHKEVAFDVKKKLVKPPSRSTINRMLAKLPENSRIRKSMAKKLENRELTPEEYDELERFYNSQQR